MFCARLCVFLHLPAQLTFHFSGGGGSSDGVGWACYSGAGGSAGGNGGNGGNDGRGGYGALNWNTTFFVPGQGGSRDGSNSVNGGNAGVFLVSYQAPACVL